MLWPLAPEGPGSVVPALVEVEVEAGTYAARRSPVTSRAPRPAWSLTPQAEEEGVGEEEELGVGVL